MIYETKTGARISASDYANLTAIQKSQCKPVKSTSEWAAEYNQISDRNRFAISMLNELRRRLKNKITNDIHDVERREIEALISEIENNKHR
jgi:hypothetical protein